jgi:hypothetical protein
MTRDAIGVCVFTLASILFGVWLGTCTSPEYCERADHSHQRRNQHPASETLALLPDRPTNQAETRNPANEAQQTEHCWHCFPMTTDHWQLIVLTLTAFVVAWQAWETRQAAEANANSARAAKESLVLTKLALRITERAYLEIDDWALLDQEGRKKISFRMINSGRTPGHDARIVLNWSVNSLPDNPNYREGRTIPGTYIVAKTPYSITTNFPTLEPQQQDAFNAGSLRVLFYGSITYKDQFGIRLHIRRFTVDMGFPNWRWSQSGYNDEIDEG